MAQLNVNVDDDDNDDADDQTNSKIINTMIHSFIHLENLYSAPSRKLLRGASSPTTVKKISFKQLVEQRRVALW